MFTGDVYIQIHEVFLVTKTPLGKPNNPHFNNDAREVALNLAIRGNEREDGNGYITTLRTNKNKFKKLPKKNTKNPEPEPTITVAELVQTMGMIYTDDEGNVFYPEVYMYTPFVKISIEDTDKLIPEGLSNRTKTVNIGTEENPVFEDQVKTWDEWFNPPSTNTYYPIIDDHIYYVSYIPYGGIIEDVLGSELILIHNSLYAELVDAIPTNEVI